MGGGVMGDLENNMDNARTTSSLARANRRARSLRCRGRVRPRRPGLSKVVDVVSNSNCALGTTIGSKSNGKYSPAVLSAFGENLAASEPRATNHEPRTFFTGKPYVEGLGHAFLMRNYRASLSKWQTADPMGYPDGWNPLAYCGNGVTSAVDLWGCKTVDLYIVEHWDYRPDANIYGAGYLLTNVWDYLKDVWSLGSGIQDALEIRTFQDFINAIKKDVESQFSDKAREDLQRILNDSYGLWQSALLKDINQRDGLLGYTENPPTDEAVASAFQAKLGFTLESCKTYSIDPKTLVGVNMEIERVGFGVSYLKRVNQKWRVTVTYE